MPDQPVTRAPSPTPITVAECLQRWWPGIRRTHRQTVLRVNRAALKRIEADPPSHKAWIESVRHLRSIGVFRDEVALYMNVDFALAAIPCWMEDPAFADIEPRMRALEEAWGVRVGHCFTDVSRPPAEWRALLDELEARENESLFAVLRAAGEEQTVQALLAMDDAEFFNLQTDVEVTLKSEDDEIRRARKRRKARRASKCP